MSEENDIKNDNSNEIIPPTVGKKEQSFLASAGSFFLELIKVLILAAITIGLVRYFLFKPFLVRGQSMEPNYEESDYLIIDELSYRFRGPERGEVVVVRAPVGSDYYLKRIIGLPGEKVVIANNQVIIYNEANPRGLVLPEDYLNEITTGSLTKVLGPDEFFVMGDNRGASYDSRRFGPVKREAIVGRVWLRGWPINRAGVLSAPNYPVDSVKN